MKLTIERDALSDAVATVARAAAGKTALPILSFVLFDADTSGAVTLTGTDLTTGLQVQVDAEVATAGRVALDPRVLGEWLASVPNGPVDIEMDAARWRTTFRASGGRITLAGLDPEDYPVFPEMTDAVATLPAPVFAAMLSRVVIATDPDPHSRPVLHGVKVEIRPDQVEVAGADGFRMAVDRIDYATGVTEPIVAIIPRDCVTALISVTPGGGELTVSLAGSQGSVMVAQIGRLTWSSRLIEGTFPNVDQIIRKEHLACLDIGRQSLRAAIRGSRSLSSANNDVVIVSSPDDVNLRLQAMSEDRGDSDATIPMTIAQGDGFAGRIALNWKYLNEALGVLDRDTVRLSFGGGSSAPVQITDPALPGHVAIVMPMQIGGK